MLQTPQLMHPIRGEYLGRTNSQSGTRKAYEVSLDKDKLFTRVAGTAGRGYQVEIPDYKMDARSMSIKAQAVRMYLSHIGMDDQERDHIALNEYF